MAGKIETLCLVLSMYSASAAVIATSKPPSAISSSTSSTTSSTSQEVIPLRTSNTYEVTENVIDIPDDRPLRPVVPTFSIVKPINIANTNVSVNKITKNDTGDENNQPKRTSFTYVHITKESDKNQDGGIKKIFKGIKDYVFTLKKGVVDGLYSYFHNDDKDSKKKDKQDEWNRQFHKSHVDVKKKNEVYDFHDFNRSYDSKEDFDYYEHDLLKHEFED